MPSTFIVTGANAGLGFEAVRQLAAKHNADKVILACRNPTKAAEAVSKLVKLTGKPASLFEVLIMDTSDVSASRAAADKVQGPIAGVVLNAGGMLGGYEKQGESGAMLGFAANVLGHAAFVQKLLEDGKLADGARVVFSGSEAARGIPPMGMKRPEFSNPPTADNFASHIDGKAYKKFQVSYAYGCTKAVGALYMSALARKYPAYQFTTVSPGMTLGTEAFRDMPWVMRALVPWVAPLILGRDNLHGPEFGAERYLKAIVGDVKESGKFFASAASRISGPLEDQAGVYSIFSDEAAQDAAFEAVQRFL